MIRDRTERNKTRNKERRLEENMKKSTKERNAKKFDLKTPSQLRLVRRKQEEVKFRVMKLDASRPQ